MSTKSIPVPTYRVQPSVMAGAYDKLVKDLMNLRNWFQNHVEGLKIVTPTSASTQGASAGNTTWNVNVESGIVVVNGTALEVAAAADLALHSGSIYTGGLASGQSAIATIVYKLDTTVSRVVVKGAAATTGAQVAPTDVAIRAACGAGKPWVKVCECTINRTADTTVTQSQNNLLRPMPAVLSEADFGDWTSIGTAA